jgi:hypothetical protein
MTPFHVSKSDFPENSLEIIREAHHALNQMDKQAIKSWDFWKQVGAGLVEVRRLAMARAMTNAPYGRGYTAAHAPILAASKLDQRIKDKGDRQKLIAVMDNLPAVEAWLETLSKEDRRRWTHPTTVYKKWQESLRPPGDYKDKDNPKDRKEAIEDALADKNVALTKENAELKMTAYHPKSFADDEEMENYLDTVGHYWALRMRDMLNKRYPAQTPMPKVQPTTDDASEDDLG